MIARFLLAAALVSLGLAALPPASMAGEAQQVWDAGRQCWRPPGDGTCGQVWDVERRQFEGDSSSSSAGNATGNDDADEGETAQDRDVSDAQARVEALATNENVEALRQIQAILEQRAAGGESGGPR